MTNCVRTSATLTTRAPPAMRMAREFPGPPREPSLVFADLFAAQKAFWSRREGDQCWPGEGSQKQDFARALGFIASIAGVSWRCRGGDGVTGLFISARPSSARDRRARWPSARASPHGTAVDSDRDGAGGPKPQVWADLRRLPTWNDTSSPEAVLPSGSHRRVGSKRAVWRGCCGSMGNNADDQGIPDRV